jgi:PAS domain S-box-containing protein
MIHLQPALPREELLDFLPVAVYTCDNEARITYFNTAAERLWGYRPDIGEKSPMETVLASGQPLTDVEAVVQRPDGTRFHALVSSNPIYDVKNKLTGAINVFRDISGKVAERQQAAEELRKSEERYHKMVEEVEDYAIILLDPKGIIQNWNKGAEKIKGWKEEDIVGKSFREFYLPEDQGSDLPSRLLEEAADKGKALYEGWRKRKDGSVFWGSVVLTALHDETGKIIGFSKVTRDLTEKKHTEDKIQEYLKQLEFQNTELEQFVYAASHDMKEPLRKIHLYNSYIAGNESNSLDEKSREYFARSMQASQRMSTLIEDLLAYAKMTTVAEELEPVDCNGIVDDLLVFYAEEFGQKKITLQRTELPVIKAIPFQVKQLFSNLIDNAVKYRHPDREACIQISSELVSGKGVSATTVRHRQFHKITVSDNGIGFDPAQAARIFEIFKRLPGTGTVKGSGIGLAICKKIVQNHDGVMKAFGEKGVGASFVLFFPAD